MQRMNELQGRIDFLYDFVLSDEQPSIEGPNFVIKVEPFKDLNFSDKLAFDFKWGHAVSTIATFRSSVKRGEKLFNDIYTYRCCSKAIPKVNDADREYHEKVVEVLDPEIQKIRNLVQFKDETMDLLCEEVKSLTSNDRKADMVPEILLYNIIRVIDHFGSLDMLLNAKACLIADYNMYKSSCGVIGKAEDHKVSSFLMEQNTLLQQLKNKIQTVDKYDDVMIMLLNMCAQIAEEENLLQPMERHAVLRAISYGLYLTDGNENIFKSKKLNIKRFITICKKYPVVPLYGDMHVRLESWIKLCPNYTLHAAVWPITDNVDVRVVREYEIIHHIPNVTRQYTDYISRFTSLMNAIKLSKIEVGTMSRDLEIELTNTILEGLSLLANWSGRVLQQSAWKFSKPFSDVNEPLTEENAYEMVVKRNYTKEECFALTEMIGFIKSLSKHMTSEFTILIPHITTCIYREIQELIQINVNKDMIAAATKKNRPNVKQDLVQLKNLGADNVDLVMEDSRKGKSKEAFLVKKRPASPNLTQLELIRIMVNSLYATRLNGKKVYSDKDISKENIKVLEDFYNRSYFYPILLDFPTFIVKVTDLGDLWYREYYLDKTKKIQFTNEQSLPWILTDKILESYNKSMTEYLLYPLDIYNDAANRALSDLEQQFLFDEIEAEVNLCFDQFLFKLSDQLYSTYKALSASILLDNPFCSHLENINQLPLHPSQTRFSILLKQRHFQLLGKTLDLNLLLSQRINNYFRRNIDNAIARYEAKDICAIVELDLQLRVIKLTHELLSQHLETLDPYDSIFNEINGSTSLVSVHSRIIFHTIFELVSDFFPNFSYNTVTQRFVKSPILYTQEVTRDPLPKGSFAFLYGGKQLNQAFNTIIDMYSNFFGDQHFSSLVNIIKASSVSLITDECLNNLGLKIDNILYPYVMELFAAMPPSSRLPRIDYQVAGCIGQFSGKLIDIMQYPDLHTDVFQHFKEMGNTITFLLGLDHAIRQIKEDTLIISAPLLGINPANLTTSFGVECSPLYKATYNSVNYFKENPDSCRSSSSVDELLINAWKADSIYRPKPPSSIWKASLDRINSFISRVRPDWDVSTPEAGAVISVESTHEFYRLFSALLFIYSMDNQNLDCYDVCGDGLLWAGCTIIHCLQQKNKFYAFDFTFHILNVNEALPHDSNDRSTSSFVANAVRSKDVIDHVFSVLDFYNQYPGSFIYQIDPPNDDIDTSSHVVSITLKSP
jgi:cytoplasmic FMR1 interacting protein